MNPLRADTEWEYEPHEGYHEEEWYDPADWFNEDNTTSYENDAWETTYDTYGGGYYDGDFDNDYVYDYADDNYVYDYGYDDYGFGNNVYDYTPDYYYWDSWNNEWKNSPRTEANRNNQPVSSRPEQGQTDRANPRRMQNESARFQGTIDGFQRVNLKTRQGRSEEHSLVRIRLRDNEKRIVSLGTNVDLNQLDLNPGERIEVSGNVARVDGRKVLVADRIQAGGRTFRVKDRNQLQAANRNRRGAMIQGTVQEQRRVNLGGSRDQNLLVRLELKNGQSRTVDLGPNTSLEQLGLGKGDNVKISGERRQVNGRPVIVARSIRIDGDRTQVRERIR